MQQKHFYHHLVEIDSVKIDLEDLDITKEEKLHLLAIFHSSIHTVIIDLILSEMPHHDKKLFMEKLEKGDDTDIWKFLHTRTIALEEKIKKTIKDIKQEFLSDIHELKRQK